MPPEKPQWAELFTEVVTSGLCTGCSACVVVCPYDVLGYNDEDGVYKPFHVDTDGGPDNCTHGLKGCTLCTRACPRFRTWEPDIETHLFGRPRTDDEVAGISRRTVLARATDPTVQGTGQDGGLVSALLIWAFEHDVIDAALVSGLEGDGSTWKAVPQVARSKEDVLATAGSRYTYSANPLAYAEAIEGGAERIALVGMGCQASAPPVMQARKAGKVARRFALSIGLLCSKTFDDAIFSELFEAQVRAGPGRHRQDEHQGRLPGLDEGRQLPRGPAEGGPRLDEGGLQQLPRLRGGARRHLHRRHRGLRRLDPHPAADREGRGALQRHGGGRRDRDPAH